MIAYFVPDLSDPAVMRRVRMLQAGGADVVVLGFRRSAAPVSEVAGAPACDLGQTRDLKLLSRVGSVALALLRLPMWSGRLNGARVVMARNLEMLVLARAALAAAAPGALLVYEVLDVHRLMLGNGRASQALRRIERALLGRVSRLLVSSPAFLDHYFNGPIAPAKPALVIENKVFAPESPDPRRGRPRRPGGPPWRIGWFGMIRCQRSLDLLTALALKAPDLVRIEIRGRVTEAAFSDFKGQVARAPGVAFHGAYNLVDLPGLYHGVHFAWSIDYFEAGLNSSWLLPNRLYEGQAHGAVPIALAGVETGRWLARQGAGLLLDDPAQELERVLRRLTDAEYLALAARTDAISIGDLVCAQVECEALVRTLEGQAAG